MPKKGETLSKSQSALMEVQMKKEQLALLKALEEKKKKLMELRIKAALAPVESVKADIQVYIYNYISLMFKLKFKVDI